MLGQANDPLRETITQATFVDGLLKYITRDQMSDRDVYRRGRIPEKADLNIARSLIFRNLFISNQDAVIAQIIWNYFSVIEEKWPEAWNSGPRQGLVLNRSTGFIALMRFLKPVYLSFESPDALISKEQFSTIFNRITLRSVDFTREVYLPGSSGQKKLYEELIEQSEISKNI